MICQKCHKNLATVRYAEVINGQVTDLMICGDCYGKMDQEATSGFNIAGKAPAPRRGAYSRQSVATDTGHLVCRSCGANLREALDMGAVGCSVCYDHFQEQLDPVLRDLHGALRHRGKVPHMDNARERLRSDLQTKRAMLRSALKTEDYEEAATLRDTIRELETALESAENSEG